MISKQSFEVRGETFHVQYVGNTNFLRNEETGAVKNLYCVVVRVTGPNHKEWLAAAHTSKDRTEVLPILTDRIKDAFDTWTDLSVVPNHFDIPFSATGGPRIHDSRHFKDQLIPPDPTS